MFNYFILDLRVYVRIFVWCYASNMAYTSGWPTTQVRTVVDMKIFTQMHKRAHAMHVTCALRHKIAWRHLTLVAICSLQRIWHLNTDMAQNKRGNCTRHETRKFTNHYVHDSHLVGRSFVRSVEMFRCDVFRFEAFANRTEFLLLRFTSSLRGIQHTV